MSESSNSELMNGSDEDKKVGMANLFWFLDLTVLFIVVVVLVHTFCYRSMHVEGDSMQTTFQPKDNVGVSDLFYEPKYSDIVIINTNDLLGRTIIKRIVAMPGQTVRIDDDGEVFVDSVKLNEPYLKKGVKTARHGFPAKTVVVPDDCFMAMGDNRPGSSDSRDFGFFRLDQILGKVFIRWWPFNKFKFF